MRKTCEKRALTMQIKYVILDKIELVGVMNRVYQLYFYYAMKKRRKQKVFKDWVVEIKKGHTNDFYNSREWDILREQVLNRDKHLCQFYLGNWNDGKHFPNEIKIVEARYVHHIVPIKVNPELALDINNCISLSFEAHEIIEERLKLIKKEKKFISEERW